MKTPALGLLLLIVAGCPPVVHADPGVSPGLFASDELPCNDRRYPGGAALTRSIPDFQRWCCEQAVRRMQRAEMLAPRDPDVMLMRATLLSAQGEKAVAEAQFLHALEGMTDAQERALARLALGEHLTRNGDLEGAQHAFEAAAKEDQALLVAQLRLASFLLFERGNSDAAIEAVERSRRARATFEASRLRSLATYLTWAVQCETAGRYEGIAQIAQRSTSTAEEAFVTAAGHKPLAILRRQAKIASLLSQRKADLHLEGRWTAADLLNVACANGDVDSVKLLVEAGVDPNAAGQDQAIPLISAVLSGSQATAAYLIERGADPERRLDGRTALDYARDAGDWGLIRMLQARTKRSI